MEVKSVVLKIGFDFYFDETPLFVEIANELISTDKVIISGVCGGKRWENILRIPDIKTYNLADYLRENWDKITIDYSTLEEIENIYPKASMPGLWGFILADRYIGDNKYEYVLKMLIGHIRFFEEYFEKEKPDVFIGPGAASLFHLVIFSVTQRYHIPFLNLLPTRIPNERFVVIRNPKDSWEKVEKCYQQLQKKGLTRQEREMAENFLVNFREEKTVPGYMKLTWQSTGFRIEFIKEFCHRLYNYYFKGVGREFYDYRNRNPFYYAFRNSYKIVWTKLLTLLNIFEQTVADERFIFFPLHLQPEATTLILAPYYVDQIALIENIAKSLPLTHKLYVKEHISCLGRRPFSYYRRIMALPNVRLISPYASSHTLINQADVMIVITSTVGWEAILYEKPVIVFGDVFYNASGLVYKINNLEDLSHIIKEAINNFQPNRERLLQYLIAIFNGTYEGVFNVPLHDKTVMSKENIKKLAKGILIDIMEQKCY